MDDLITPAGKAEFAAAENRTSLNTGEH